jgi:hypothetical protein
MNPCSASRSQWPKKTLLQHSSARDLFSRQMSVLKSFITVLNSPWSHVFNVDQTKRNNHMLVTCIYHDPAWSALLGAAPGTSVMQKRSTVRAMHLPIYCRLLSTVYSFIHDPMFQSLHSFFISSDCYLTNHGMRLSLDLKVHPTPNPKP